MMGWKGPLLTDSGGFQVMSLSPLRQLTEDGVTFKSHLDGSKHHVTPERSTEIQHLLDATITMVFDECTPFPATKAGGSGPRWPCRCAGPNDHGRRSSRALVMVNLALFRDRFLLICGPSQWTR